jgi:tetratricopeptide (TPR) repeat protein
MLVLTTAKKLKIISQNLHQALEWSEQVKLDPSRVDAWCCLGNCFWKKGDLSQAKNCFNYALSKGLNKKALQQLSMLERRIAKGSPDEAETIEESIRHAKQAVTLDIKDGQSWYTLGNAFFTSFFVTGAWDQSKLHQSLKAYQNVVSPLVSISIILVSVDLV